jgi:rhodanese-related sulfurtransferase
MNRNSAYTQRVEQLADECQREFPNAPGLSPNEFVRRSKQEDWAIVDVRSPRERAVSIIPGAVSRAEFETQLEEHRAKHVLAYCTAGCRSGAYAQKLREKGLDAFSLSGGVLAWSLDEGSFVTVNGQPTRRVHVNGERWDVLPPGYQAVR